MNRLSSCGFCILAYTLTNDLESDIKMFYHVVITEHHAIMTIIAMLQACNNRDANIIIVTSLLNIASYYICDWTLKTFLSGTFYVL